MSKDTDNNRGNKRFVGDVVCTEEDFEFAEATTCHGLKMFCNHWAAIRRIIWFLIVMASLGMLGYMLGIRITEFIKFEMQTNIELVQKKSLALPAITICNVNVYSNPYITAQDQQLFSKISFPLTVELIELLESTFGADGEQFFQNKTAMDNIGKALIKKVGKFEDVENEILGNGANGFVMSKWMEKIAWKLFGHEKSTLKPAVNSSNFVWCKIGSKFCTKEDFVIVHTESGPCYSFNVNRSMPFTQRRRGIQNGLLLTVDVREVDYSGYGLGLAVPFGAGLKVILHEMDEYPDVQKAVAIPTGASSYIPVKKIVKTTVDEIPWNSCSTNPKRRCVRECEAKRTLNWCGCQLWFEPNPDNTKQCGVAYSTYCIFLKTIAYALEQEDEYRNLSCTQSCPESCEEVSYDFSVSYNSLVSQNGLKSIKANLKAAGMDEKRSPLLGDKLLNADYVRANLVTASIGYEMLEEEVIASTPKQSVSAFISDIGGQLGLFAGISVITLCELLEYPFLKLRLFMHRRRHR